MSNTTKKIGALATGALLVAAAYGVSAYATLAYAAAADEADAAAAERSDGASIPSITVSATRRNASLQSVPVAVSVLDGEQLAQSNRNSIDTIVQEVPSVTFRQQGGNKDSTIFVRGIGTISTSPGVEPTVSTVIDGVVYARPGQATLDLLDIERIEILRGPQGTLFGKNASSGVLHVIGTRPTERTGGFVEGSWYQGDEKRVRAGVAGALVPGVARASLTTLYADYAGNIDNVHPVGGKLNGYNRRGARARVDIAPNRDLDIALIADVVRSKTSPTFVAAKSTNAAFSRAISPVVAAPDNRQVNTDIPSDIHDKNKGLSWMSLGMSVLTWRFSVPATTGAMPALKAAAVDL